MCLPGISNAEAYRRYIDCTLQFIKVRGGDLVFLDEDGKYLVGPQEDQSDLVMLVRQRSLSDFMAFALNQDY